MDNQQTPHWDALRDKMPEAMQAVRLIAETAMSDGKIQFEKAAGLVCDAIDQAIATPQPAVAVSAESAPTFTAEFLWQKAQWYADDFERMMKAMGEGNRNHALRDLAHSIMMDTMKNVDKQRQSALSAAKVEGARLGLEAAADELHGRGYDGLSELIRALSAEDIAKGGA